MLINHIKHWSSSYTALFILLTALAGGYFYRSPDPVYFAAANALLLAAVSLTATYIAAMVRATKSIRTGNLSTYNLLTNLSHEFRTPMIGIIGAVDLLERENLTRGQFDNVEIIKNSGRTLLTVIDNILDLNKLELGRAEINPRPFSLKKIINSCAVEVSSFLKSKGLNLTIDMAANAHVIAMLDEQKLKQLILNLLNKAIEYAENGSIILKAFLERGLDNNYLLLSVAYTGTCDQPLPDNPLESLDNSAADEFTGSLGLYFCRKLTEFMGGQFWISRHANKSSVFQLCLPIDIVSDDQVADPESDFSNIASLASFARVKILLVEDNNFNIKILSQMLYNYGFEVKTANNGLECLQILQEQVFDVILMDMQMPLMDGYEASRIISGDPDYSSIPIIAVTANAMLGDREKCLACGCTSYLAKPFQSRELTQEIKQVLANKKVIKKSISAGPDNPARLWPEFLDLLGKSIGELEEAYKKTDWNLIISICHDIKSIATVYSNKDIYNYASLIEAAARGKIARIVNLTLIDLNTSYKSLSPFDELTGTSVE